MSLRRPRWIIGTVIAAGIAVLLYFLPLFLVVPLRQADPSRQAGQPSTTATFEPVAFVEQFWNERLIPGAVGAGGTVGAVDASELVAAVKQDRPSARKTHGHSVGLGNGYYYFITGTGHVVSVEKNSIGLSLQDGQRQVQVSLESGNIFGNAVRDGTGLLDVNNFANSQDFNSVSAEINRRIESDVLPGLREKAVVGVQIRFVGCAEITDEDTDLHPLRVVPFIVEIP